MNNLMRHTKGVALVDMKLYLAFMLMVLALALSACSQKSNQDEVLVSGDTLSAPLPSALLAFDETNLRVGVVVDDGASPQACSNLSVDQVNGTYSCSITLSGGSHTISLVFSVIDATYGTVQVATTSDIDVEVVPGQTASADFSTVTLTRVDTDKDGIDNLAELDEGSNPNELSYYVGGTVSGLSGSGAVIQLNGGSDLTLTSDFKFIPAVANSTGYTVSVLTQPSGQTCIVSNGSGTVNGANVTNVTVTCVAIGFFTIGGTITGLEGSGGVLQLNGANDLPLDFGPGNFVIGSLSDGSGYTVSVLTQPSNQTCTVTNGSGTVSDANVTNVTVTCVTTHFSIGGDVTGLVGSGLVLQNNGGDNLTISADGGFNFTTTVVNGGAYAVTVLIQPSTPNQTCTVRNDSGTVSGGDVIDVQVMCSCILGSSLIGSCTLE